MRLSMYVSVLALVAYSVHGRGISATMRPATIQVRAPLSARLASRPNSMRYQQKESQRESLRSGAFSPRQATQRKPLVAYAETANAFLGAIDDLIHARPAGKLKTAVITGASSGLGLNTAKALIDSGKWHVVMAVRNPEKAKLAATQMGFPKDRYSIMPLELESFESVRSFSKKLKATRNVDTLICNAALYLPAHQNPRYTNDGYEVSQQVNHLSHFLLVNELLPHVKRSKDPRIIIVGSITGNTNTVGGGAVWPWADLGKLNGLAEATDKGPAMMNGGTWNGAKAYKDSKLANMMTILEADRRFHDKTGVTFSTMYPGCIAETGLFRDKKPWFRKLFPLFMRYVTGGYVSESEAGERLAEVAMSDRCKKSGVYWGWNGAAKTVAYLKPGLDANSRGLTGAGGAGGSIEELPLSVEARDPEKARRLWELSAKAVGLPYDSNYVSPLHETAAEIAAKNGPKSLPGIPLPSFVPDSRGQLDKRAKEGTSSQFQGGRL
mmetsp:Transcript_4650/g.9058  ORF Transcript_4650/g.9058 Transcript_4650/m.9058 type:complete len:495 (+) Transcript_4650:161-1645(+)